LRGSSQGRFVTFEGGEGAGKTTLIKAVHKALKKRGVQKILITREPGGTPAGKRIRSLLLHSSSLPKEGEFFLYMADRMIHIYEKITPHLAQGYHILCDRYHDSTLAYQGFGRGLPVEEWCEPFKNLLLTPHRTYLLDISPEKGFVRKKGRPDRMEKESLAFYEKVREGYLSLAKMHPERFVILNGENSVEENLKEVLRTYPF